MIPERFGELIDAGEVFKSPCPFEQVEAVGILSFQCGRKWVGGGHIVGAGRQRVLVKDTEVVEMSRNDHCSGSLRVGENRGRTAVRRCNNNVLIVIGIYFIFSIFLAKYQFRRHVGVFGGNVMDSLWCKAMKNVRTGVSAGCD